MTGNPLVFIGSTTDDTVVVASSANATFTVVDNPIVGQHLWWAYRQAMDMREELINDLMEKYYAHQEG